MIPDAHIVGFVEGEGCFSIAVALWNDTKPRKTGHKNHVKKPSNGFVVRPTFRINIREDDRSILEAIREKLGVGKIYIQQKEKYNPNFGNTAHYYVQSFADLLVVRDFFKKQVFYTKKGKDFERWSQCLEIMEKKQHLTPEGFARVCEIRDQMNYRKNKTLRYHGEIDQILNSKREHILAHAETTKSST